MDVLGNLAHGFAVALTPTNLMWSLVGVTLGTAIGILPGIGPALTIALLLPVTYKIDPTSAFIIFGGLYYGAMYGCSTTSILINTPGETGSIVTTIDGNKMARAGRGAAALATSAIGSFVAGIIGTLLLAALAPEVVKLALLFGPADYFALMVVAFAAVSSLLGSSVLRGLVSLFIGIAVGLVGIDQQTGQSRFTFGVLELQDGLGVVLVAVALFAVGEALYLASRPDLRREELVPVKGRAFMTREDWARSWRPWLRGAAIGFPFGALPAGGTELPTFISYKVEKSLARNPDEFGKGAIEGVAGPEAANNSATQSAFIPLFVLGIPFGPVTAILLGALLIHGVTPGPLLITDHPELFWAVIASMYIGNFILLLLNLPFVPLFANMLRVPKKVLLPLVMLFCFVGMYSVHNSVPDIWVMLGCGALGYILRGWAYEGAPLLLGLVLGPMLEVAFRQSLMISHGDFAIFVTRPVSVVLLLATAVFLVLPLLKLGFRALRGRRAAGAAAAEGEHR